MFGDNTGIVIAFLVLDMVVTIGVVAWFLSRRKSGNGQNGSGQNGSTPNTFANPTAPSPWAASQNPTAPIDNLEARNLIAQGQKIQAIKRVRELSGLGLKEAKDAVEAIERQMR